ncbi:SapB/AmfS family lanthipeptide [Streptomyces spongiae]|uniref:SapB/AmfS family lantipeptide n=1 Tax=Streptomyces spongiae TaxID=565072 RepID=A0A5N8XL08_9ACTN|nr:SapB/AmfS family lanthipeptide [Streptomyces spongiae]MPY60153.1 SapB/AmfS family lantipeptide [Streptomyces spongiae]
MALLDLQTMEADEMTGGAPSSLSVLSCVSAASITLCL